MSALPASMDNEIESTKDMDDGDREQSPVTNKKLDNANIEEPVLLDSVAVPQLVESTLEVDQEISESNDPAHSVTEDMENTTKNKTISSSTTSFVNTSDDSLIQHADVLSARVAEDGSQDTPSVNEDSISETLVSSNADETQQIFQPLDDVSGSIGSSGVAQQDSSVVNSPSLEEREKYRSAASLSNSPVLNDRKLEQFSEILLDSDPSQSDDEAPTQAVHTPQVESPENKGKLLKKVRFADEVHEDGTGVSRQGTHSPPLRPTNISSPEDVARQGRVPVSPSSPRQPVQDLTPQYSINELIAGVDFSAQYLGSTPIFLSGVASAKSSRMYQAQQAVKLIKDPENDGRPQSGVNVKVSTQCITISDSQTNVDMMEHPLHTISYVADIDNVLVIMAHVIPTSDPTPLSPVATPVENREELVASYTPKMTCHVLDTENARLVAMVIGQAFSAAYKQFLRSNGISEEALEQAEYTHILNAQTVPQVEIESFNDRNKTRKLTLAKHKGELMGMMVMESGYGSAIPSCVIAHLSKSGAAIRSGLLNVGDHIISINGVNLVGMPKKACIEQLKKCRYQDVVKMNVCSCPAVVEVTIVRPDLKYQLGFSVQKGMITSLIRGSIAERSGVRVGHRIIEINGTSTVAMDHNDVVHLLSCTVGDLHLRTMPDLMYKLLTGQLVPEYH